MRSHSRPFVFAAGLLVAGATLFAGPGTGCSSFIAESALTLTDFCFVFDCQNGILGGTVDPCAGTDIGDQSGEQPIFTDCPGFVGP